MLVFIQNFLVHPAEKIPLMQPVTFGEDYRKISRMGILSGSAHFLITLKNPVSITPIAPNWFKPGQGCTRVNS
jgi:hypothetical protein